MSHGCPSWQPSCAFRWSAPDGPEWLGMAHADYASPNRGGGRKAGGVALKTSQSAALTAPLSGEPRTMSHDCPFWQPSCAFRWSAPDGPEWLGMTHADYASPNRGGGRKAGEVALKNLSVSCADSPPIRGAMSGPPSQDGPYEPRVTNHYFFRLWRKKSFIRAAHSSARTPAVTSVRWLRRSLSTRWNRDRTAPALGSSQP